MQAKYINRQYDYIQANDKLLILPRLDETYAAYNPVTCTVAYISALTLDVLLYLNVPHTIDGLWDRFKTPMPNLYSDFSENIINLIEDGFIEVLDHKIEVVPSIAEPREVPVSPMHIVIHTTYRCNLDCDYCYNKIVRDAKHHELVYKEWTRIFDQLQEMDIQSVIISGGEPMLRADLFPLIAKLKANGIKTTLGTNGTLISERNISSICNAFSEVNLSIDSHDEKINDINRGVGTHSKSIYAAKLLTKHGITWRAQMVFNIHTYKYFSETETFVRNLGAAELVVSVDTTSDQAKLNMKEYTQPKHWALTGKSTPVEKAKACDAGFNLCAIDPQGCIYPCQLLMDKSFKGLSILDFGFSKSWKDSDCLNLMRNFKYEEIAECKKCNFAGICNGGCRGFAFAETGHLGGFIGNLHCGILKWTILESMQKEINE